MSTAQHETEAIARLASAIAAHRPAGFACSFGLEDMVILDMLARHALPTEIFTIDTGRLPEETHALIATARQHSGRAIRILSPQADAVEAWVAVHGPDGFRASLDARKACCAARKVEPLGRALAGKRLWITGLRRQQSVTRNDLAVLAEDRERQIFKLNPLANWTDAQVRDYLGRHRVPVNALHSKGYPSIGCAPCTRPIASGEDARAGRWWWETPEQKECGLHVACDGRLVRAASAGSPSLLAESA